MVDRKYKHPADFCYLDTSPELRLSRFERLTLVGGKELDRAIAWFSGKVARLRPAISLKHVDIPTLLESSSFYTESRWINDPASFYIPPDVLPVVSVRKVHGLRDGEVVDLSFDSQYRPRNDLFLREYRAVKENLTVNVRYWRHHDPSAPVLIALHGWTMGDHRLSSLTFLPGLFYRLGFNVALMELPYHGRRAPVQLQGNESNDPLFPGTHVVRTNEGMGQMISDIRSFRMYVDQLGAGEVGVIGMSLGAYIASLWHTLDQVQFCINIVPLVSMAELAFEFLNREPSFQEFQRMGLTLEKLKAIYHVHCPLSHTFQRDPGSALIIAGIGDKIVPPEQPRMLWNHWNNPEIHWISGGHLAHFRKSETFSVIMKFLSGLGYAPPAIYS